MAIDKNNDTKQLLRFAHGEYLAHHFAYNAAKTASEPSITIPGSKDTYTKHKVPGMPHGLQCHILIPQNGSDAKIVFRGTADLGSAIRNLCPEAAGHRTFNSAKIKILELLENLLETNNNVNSMTITGHSLGGADAQRMLKTILEQKINNKLAQINKVHLQIYNATGVSKDTATLCDLYANKLAIDKQLEISMDALIVGGDAIQQTGTATVLSNIEPTTAKVTVLKADVGAEGTWTGTGMAHSSYHSHIKDGKITIPEKMKYAIYNNQSIQGKQKCNYELSYKSYLINNSAAYTVRYVLYNFAKTAYSQANNVGRLINNISCLLYQ